MRRSRRMKNARKHVAEARRTHTQLQPVHETKREAEVDLTWWWSSRLHFTFGYTYQRIENPGQITNISPFVETFAAGVTAKNHLFWTSMALQF